jgi:hypothetical protein
MGNDIVERTQAAEDSKNWYEQAVSMSCAILGQHGVREISYPTESNAPFECC